MGTIRITPEELRIAEKAIDDNYAKIAVENGIHVDRLAAVSARLQILARRLEKDGREALEFEHPGKEDVSGFIPAKSKGVQS